MFKMVSHTHIGPQRPKLEIRVLKWVIVSIAAFCCTRRYQSRIAEVLNYQKLVSHAEIGLQRPEIAPRDKLHSHTI